MFQITRRSPFADLAQTVPASSWPRLRPLFALLLAALLGSPASADPPSITGLNLTYVSGLSEDGTAVIGEKGGTGYRWTSDGGLVHLGGLSAGNTNHPYGISGDGSVVVGYSLTLRNSRVYREAYRWTESGGMQGIGRLPYGTGNSWAWGVSGDGSTIVGYSDVAGGAEAFKWTAAGGMVGLGDLAGGYVHSRAYAISADAPVIVGFGQNSATDRAVRWPGGPGIQSLGVLPGEARSYAHAVSPDGSVIAGDANTSSGDTAFRWTEQDGKSYLGVLPGGRDVSHALDVSATGLIVGEAEGANGWEAFIWDEVSGMRSLQDVLVDEYGLDLMGWQLTSAGGISADGMTIAGSGTNPSGGRQAWIVTIPEPATLALLAFGGLALLRRRR